MGTDLVKKQDGPGRLDGEKYQQLTLKSRKRRGDPHHEAHDELHAPALSVRDLVHVPASVRQASTLQCGVMARRHTSQDQRRGC